MKSPETLLEAVEQGDLKRLMELIESGADVNELDEETPLGKAAELGRADLVRELLKAGADVDQGGLQAPIVSAVHAGSAKVIELLLKAGAAVDAQSEGGESALMAAAAKGDLTLVKRLLKAGANAQLEDEDGQAAILYGAKWPKIVKLLQPLSSAEQVEFIARAARQVGGQVEAFLAAARAGDVKRVRELLDLGAPVDGMDQGDETALHIAVETHNGELFDLLLAAGADVNARNRYCRTPLWEAANHQELKFIERLIAAGADVNPRDQLGGTTPFLSTIGSGQKHLDTLRLLARHGAEVKAVDDYGQTTLTLADRYLNRDYDAEVTKQAAALRELQIELGVLDRHADAFTEAAGAGDLAAVDKFLANGVPVNAVDAKERTALYMAVSRQQLDVVKALLQAGADVHQPVGSDPGMDVQWGGFARACPSCGHGFVSLLVDRQCPKCGQTFTPQKQEQKLDGALYLTWSNGHLPLTVAARTNHVEIIKALIDAGAEVDRGREGLTPLMVAASFGHLEAARVLIERGADAKRECQSPDRLKNTLSPVLLAAGHKHYTMVRLLWDAGAPAQDKQSTMLVAAAECGDVKEIKRLLAEGTEPNTPDPLTGEWPLNAAAKAGNPAAVEALLQAGARAAPAPRQTAPILQVVFGIERKVRRKEATAEVVEDHVQVAKLLLAAGANPTSRCFGSTPLSLAEDLKCQPLIEILKAAEPPRSKLKRKK